MLAFGAIKTGRRQKKPCYSKLMAQTAAGCTDLIRVLIVTQRPVVWSWTCPRSGRGG